MNTRTDTQPLIELTPEISPQPEQGGAGCCGPLPGLRWSMEEAGQLAAMLKALAHPVRLQIVGILSRFGGQVCVWDVESQFDLAQPTISHHLKVLREAGLVDAEQRGVWVYDPTGPEALAQLQTVVGGLSGNR